MDVRLSRRSVLAALMSAPLFVYWGASSRAKAEGTPVPGEGTAQEYYRRMVGQTFTALNGLKLRLIEVQDRSSNASLDQFTLRFISLSSNDKTAPEAKIHALRGKGAMPLALYLAPMSLQNNTNYYQADFSLLKNIDAG